MIAFQDTPSAGKKCHECVRKLSQERRQRGTVKKGSCTVLIRTIARGQKEHPTQECLIDGDPDLCYEWFFPLFLFHPLPVLI
jgi:hypothetical protein